MKTREAAEEVVQETWVGVLRGLGRFEGRSSFMTWIVRILRSNAITCAGRDVRAVAFSWLVPANSYPAARDSLPEEEVLGREAPDVVKAPD